MAEALNRTRPLTPEMIRRLSEGLGLPVSILVRRFETKR
jgi:antitoxin component HigA of HigAB toxin-antitoxin module